MLKWWNTLDDSERFGVIFLTAAVTLLVLGCVYSLLDKLIDKL
jgi:hypothetical protein